MANAIPGVARVRFDEILHVVACDRSCGRANLLAKEERCKLRYSSQSAAQRTPYSSARFLSGWYCRSALRSALTLGALAGEETEALASVAAGERSAASSASRVAPSENAGGG